MRGLGLDLLAAAALCLTASACEKDPARIAVEVEGTATADPLVFHGNCFAGWSVGVTLRVRETSGADAWLEGLAFGLRDAGLDEEIVADVLDASSLESRYGTTLVAGRGQLLLPLSGPVDRRPVGPIAVHGELEGRDEHSNAFRVPFRLEAASLVVHDVDPGPGGACP